MTNNIQRKTEVITPLICMGLYENLCNRISVKISTGFG